MRVVVADDVMLVRSGLARLLTDAGVDVVGEAADADALLKPGRAGSNPDVAIVDIRMPPTHTDEGLVAARRIRERYPTTAVVVLSQYLEARYAQRLLADQPGGLGYLLKERVSDIAVLIDALRRVTEGECVIDPTIVSRLMQRRRPDSPLSHLTPREREILALMAEGRSNSGIAASSWSANAPSKRSALRYSASSASSRPGRQPSRAGSAHVAPQLSLRTGPAPPELGPRTTQAAPPHLTGPTPSRSRSCAAAGARSPHTVTCY